MGDTDWRERECKTLCERGDYVHGRSETADQ